MSRTPRHRSGGPGSRRRVIGRPARRGPLDQGARRRATPARRAAPQPWPSSSTRHVRRLAFAARRHRCRPHPARADDGPGHLPVGDRPPLLRAGRHDRPPAHDRGGPGRRHGVRASTPGATPGRCPATTAYRLVCRAVAQRSLAGGRRGPSTTSSTGTQRAVAQPGAPDDVQLWAAWAPDSAHYARAYDPSSDIVVATPDGTQLPVPASTPLSRSRAAASWPAAGWTSRTLMVTYALPDRAARSTSTRGRSVTASWRASGRLTYARTSAWAPRRSRCHPTAGPWPWPRPTDRQATTLPW